MSNNKLMYKKIVDFAFGISERQGLHFHNHTKGKKYAKTQARRQIRRFYNKESEYNA